MSEISNSIVWIPKERQRPLCDVPWLGTSVVLSDGAVAFCCFSNAVVGNVNEYSFEKIWNGQVMQGIRRQLIEQQFPPECQTPSCPIFRHDDLNYIAARMKEHTRSATDRADLTRRQATESLKGSALTLESARLHLGHGLNIRLDLCRRGPPLIVDIFIAIRSPNGECRFLPNFESFAVPFLSEFQLENSDTRDVIDAFIPADQLQTPGEFEICAALFKPYSNPNIIFNCYWSQTKTFPVQSASSARSEAVEGFP